MSDLDGLPATVRDWIAGDRFLRRVRSDFAERDATRRGELGPELLRWRTVPRYGTPEERDALVASLCERDLEVATSTLDVPDEQVMAVLREAVLDCAGELRRRPFDAPV